MTPWKLVLADAVSPAAWRNGGGQTRELYTWPPGVDWQLRISLADIEQDGLFSAYPGVQRHFAVLEGGGVQLQFDDQVLSLRRGDAPLVFDGALAPACQLLDGPTRDLNLMLRGLHGGLHGAEAGPAPQAAWRALLCAGPANLLGLPQGPMPLPAFSLLLDLPPLELQLHRLDDAPAYWITAALRSEKVQPA